MITIGTPEGDRHRISRCGFRRAVGGHGWVRIHIMTTQAEQLIQRFYDTLGNGDLDGVVDLYGSDAVVIRFNATSTGQSEIRRFHAEELGKHDTYQLFKLDQLTESGDVLMWDALVTTSNGIIETTEVLVLDDEGKIRRHIPGFRGYWGR